MKTKSSTFETIVFIAATVALLCALASCKSDEDASNVDCASTAVTFYGSEFHYPVFVRKEFGLPWFRKQPWTRSALEL